MQQPQQIKTLQDAFQNQNYLQTEVYGDGTQPSEYDRERAISFYKDMHIALVDELHEALQEIGWKPWASSNHFTHDAVKGELVDAFHFFMNLCLVSKVSADDLLEGYAKKSAKNIQRQEEGYDGVSTKCVACNRALDDDAVKCYDDTDGDKIDWWCDLQKHGVKIDG